MDTQEILPENIEESHLPNSGLDEIEAAMEKISEIENTDTDASEKKLEENPENKTKEINLENPDAKEDSNTEVEEAQAEKTEDEFSALQQKEKPNKLWHEKKLKFKAIAEKEAIAAENEQLKKMLDDALDSGSYHHAKSIETELSMARDLKRKAIENGDMDSMFKADEAYNKALIAKHEIDKWNYQQGNQKPKTDQSHREPQDRQEQNYNNLTPLQKSMAQEWVESHPELNPTSRSYDKNLAEKVAPYINNLESNINQSGQMQYLYSSEFFDMIDNHIDKVKTPKVNTPPLSSNNVAGVKKSYQSSSTAPPSTKKQIVLTAEEKIMASNAGVSEKDWLKFKIEELNKGK
jgi:hypothetical protein